MSVLNYSRTGSPAKLSEAESDRVLNTITATYISLINKEDVGDREDVLNTAIEATRQYIEQSDLSFASSLFTPSIRKFNLSTRSFDIIDNPDYLHLREELEIRITKAEKLKEPFLEEDQGENISDENEDDASYLFADSINANEVGFGGWSNWMRSYISTVAASTYLAKVNGFDVDVVVPINANVLYYGVARNVQNTSNDIVRLLKMIEFSELNAGENATAKAFIYQLFGDVTGIKDSGKIKDFITSVRKTVAAVERNDNETDASYWKKVSEKLAPVFNGYNTKLLNGLIKGFDLWRRDMYVQTINQGKEAKTFNANIDGNSTRTQVDRWNNAYQFADRSYNTLFKSIDVEIEGTPATASTILNDRANTIKLALKSQIGVDVSASAIKFLLMAENPKTKFLPEDEHFFSLFKGDVHSVVKQSETEKLLSGIWRNISEKNMKSVAEIQAMETVDPDTGTLFDRKGFGKRDVGIYGRLENLAKVNAFFDENVLETTYKNAENKTIYTFQWKNFALEFVRNVTNSSYMNEKLSNGLKVLRIENENPVYLEQGIEFLRENRLLTQTYNTWDAKNSVRVPINGLIKQEGGYWKVKDEFNQMFQNLKLITEDGLRQTGWREADGVTFGGSSTPDFDAFRLNLYDDENIAVNVNGIKFVPFYVGNYEAKRSADFVYLPITEYVDGKGNYNKKVAEVVRDEFRKEFERIVKLRNQLEKKIENVEWNANNEYEISHTWVRENLGIDSIDKFNTGKIKRVETGRVEAGNPVYRYIGLRGLQFSDVLKGMLNSSNTQELLNYALDGGNFNEGWKESYNADAVLQQDKQLLETVKRLRFEALVGFGYKTPIINYLNKSIEAQEKGEKYEAPIPDGIGKLRNLLSNNLFNTTSYNQLMHGDNALLFKNDGVDAFKRFGGKNAAIQSSEYYITNPSLGIHEAQQYITYVVGEELQGFDGYNGKGVDVADAQNWGTVEYFRKQLYAQGKLDKYQADLLDKIALGIPLTDSEIRNMQSRGVSFNVMKTVAFDGLVYLKKSDFMLSREFTSVLLEPVQNRVDGLNRRLKSLMSNPVENKEEIAQVHSQLKELYTPEANWMARPEMLKLHNMRVALESNKIDLYMPKSASKMLNVNVHDNITDSTFSTIGNNINFIEAKYYGLQLENPSGKKRIYDPTQMMEIIFNEQDKEVKVIDGNGVETDLGELSKLYNEYLIDRDNGVYDTLKSEIIFNNGEVNFPALFSRMTEMLIESDADYQTVEIFKKGINPNIGITREKFEQLYFSLFTKGVMKQKVAGDAVAHLSSYGIQQIKRAVKHTFGEKEIYTWENVQTGSKEYYDVIYERNGNKAIELSVSNSGVLYDGTKDTDNIREAIKELYSEDKPKYFIDDLRHLKPRYAFNEEGQLVSDIPIAYYSESVIPKWDEDIDINNNSKWMFGTRIPSQDKHSAVNVEWVNTMPSFYGNTISVAKEIINLSGSDFGFDRLFLIRPETYRWNGEIRYYGKNGNSEDVKFIEYIEYLKQYSRRFNRDYKIFIKVYKNSNYEVFKEIYILKILKYWFEEYKDLVKNVKDKDAFIREILKIDIGLLSKRITELYEQKAFLSDDFQLGINRLLSDLNLPTKGNFLTEGPLVHNHRYSNPLDLNNRLLELRQIALTNSSTLNEETGQAIYKTPATQDALRNLRNSPLFQKEGERIFNVTQDVPLHSFLSNSIYHQNNSTGKRNISAGVNGNLALINIINGGLEVNKDFITEINGHVADGFRTLNQNQERVFDQISALISAATDEAKDQQNATYNISLKALGIVRVMVGLGYTMETTIAFINQPIVQRYFDAFKLRDLAILTDEESRTDYRTSEAILEELGWSDVPVRGITNEQLSNNLKEGSDVSGINTVVLSALNIFERMSTQFDEINRLVKLKKGFGGGLNQLNKLNETLVSLGIKNLENPRLWKETHPINTINILGNPALGQINNFIKRIIPDQNFLTRKIFLKATPFYRRLSNNIKFELGSLNQKNEKVVNNAIFEYVSVLSAQQEGILSVDEELYISGASSLASRIRKLREDVNEFKKRQHKGLTSEKDRVLSTLIGNTALNRLIFKFNTPIYGDVKADTIELNTFSKIGSEEQESLVSAFQILDVATSHPELYKDNIEYKNIAQDLFRYFVTKDAYQFKYKGISKIFPASYFAEYGKAIENIVEENNPLLSGEHINFFENDFFNIFINHEKNRKLFKRMFKRKGGLVENTYKIDGGKLRLMYPETLSKELIEKANENYNIVFGKDGMSSIPKYMSYRVYDSLGSSIDRFYILQSVDGRVKTNEKFLSHLCSGGVRQAVYVEAAPVVANTFQSIFTQELEI